MTSNEIILKAKEPNAREMSLTSFDLLEGGFSKT